jgi:glycosyltransferase involved in cell wall biosynthesis
MPEERIFVVPNAADRDYFRRQADALLPQCEALRHELGLSVPTFLFVGRLVESIKGVEALIRAVARLAGKGHALHLLLAGEGPDADAYATLSRELGAPVQLLGNLDHDTLCRVYAATDGLVLPSRSEVWGFVLNEAMEFGQPLIVSEAVGAGPDLVTPGENGFIVPVDDVDALADALRRLLDPAIRQRFGAASRRRVEDFSPDSWARGVLEAIGLQHLI